MSPLRARMAALRAWQQALRSELAEWAGALAAADLLGPSSRDAAEALGESLVQGGCVVAVCGAPGAGKTGLVNALLASEGGDPLLPQAPTRCPVELGWDPQLSPGLALLPLATRRQPGLVSEWRRQPARWHHLPLGSEAGAAALLAEAVQTQRVSRRQAAALGLLPPGGVPGPERVEVPAWRHVLANLPHPLLQAGVCLLDTPALQSMAAEPELVLEQLPAADVVLMVQAAAAPVPEAERAEDAAPWPGHPRTLRVIWRETGPHGPAHPERPEHSAKPLALQGPPAPGLPPGADGPAFRVDGMLALQASARQDGPALAASGLPALAVACGDLLLAWRHQRQAAELVSGVMSLMEDAQRRLREQRRGHAQQLLELRGLRQESSERLAQLKLQMQEEGAALDHLATVLDALLLAQDRALRQSLEALDASHLQAAAAHLKSLLAGGLLRAPTRAAGFEALCRQLRQQADLAARHSGEAALNWVRARERLRRDFGLAAAELPIPDLSGLAPEVDLIERGYLRYFTLPQAVRLSAADAAEPLRRMLLAKFKLLFAGARQELLGWQAALNPSVREPLAQRRAQLERRAQGLARIEQAADDLDRHLAELQARDDALLATLDRARQGAARLRQRAEQGPARPASP